LELGQTATPLAAGLELNEELDVVKGGDIGVVVGAPALGDDVGYLLRVVEQLGADLVGQAKRSFRGNVLGEGGAHPEVPFLQLGHEFAAQMTVGEESGEERNAGQDDHSARAGDQAGNNALVPAAQPADQTGFTWAARERARCSIGREHGGKDHGEEKSAEERIDVGDGHGGENLSGNAAHAEQRDEGGQDGSDGEEHGPPGFGHGRGDDVEDGRIGIAVTQAQVDVLEDNDGAVHQNAEIDGADGNQVGGLAGEDQAAEREQERGGNGHGGDGGDPDVTEKDEEQDGDQEEAEENDFADRVRSRADEIGAIVDGLHLHPRREKARVHSLDSGAQRGQSGKRGLVELEEDDSLDDVGVAVHAHFAEARLDALVDIGDIFEENRNAVVLGDQNALHLAHVVQQADAADVGILTAESEIAAAHVGIAGADRGDHLGQIDVELDQLLGIHLGLILAGGAAEGGHINDAGNLLHFPADHPVLLGFEGVERIGRAGDDVAENFAGGRPGRELGLEVRGKGDELDAVEGLLPVAEIIAAILEIELHVTQTEQADGARDIEVRDAE